MSTLKFEKNWSAVFTEALFITAPNWKLPKCPLTVERINLQYIHPMEYYITARSMNELQQQTILINLIKVMLSKRSQMQQSTHLMIPFIQGTKTDETNPCKSEVRRVVAAGGQWKGYKRCFWVAGDVLFLDLSAGSMGMFSCGESWSCTLTICALV